MEVVGTTTTTTRRQLPHLREHCERYPIGVEKELGEAVKYCEGCYCYVCDRPAAECGRWGEHFAARYGEARWAKLRAEGKRSAQKSTEKRTKKRTLDGWFVAKTKPCCATCGYLDKFRQSPSVGMAYLENEPACFERKLGESTNLKIVRVHDKGSLLWKPKAPGALKVMDFARGGILEHWEIFFQSRRHLPVPPIFIHSVQYKVSRCVSCGFGSYPYGYLAGTCGVCGVCGAVVVFRPDIFEVRALRQRTSEEDALKKILDVKTFDVTVTPPNCPSGTIDPRNFQNVSIVDEKPQRTNERLFRALFGPSTTHQVRLTTASSSMYLRPVDNFFEQACHVYSLSSAIGVLLRVDAFDPSTGVATLSATLGLKSLHAPCPRHVALAWDSSLSIDPPQQSSSSSSSSSSSPKKKRPTPDDDDHLALVGRRVRRRYARLGLCEGTVLAPHPTRPGFFTVAFDNGNVTVFKHTTIAVSLVN